MQDNRFAHLEGALENPMDLVTVPPDYVPATPQMSAKELRHFRRLVKKHRFDLPQVGHRRAKVKRTKR